ncbi:hypothetical protein SAMD00019534_081790 [Acytostelium subglobosum LB1]|uniref:hypothetical protein n=1 Tax=Acytostelium subglobosum LB1 TaxID=1410327 RepID=UPI000644A961|nr:hypothetical protein SAMD00019534_081790 [Acytostelium subglobosum LB1]GAM25004.1 hypothetical protein SAMD00019534_081790 [Acytostelium subglobosum LB1]|eukprot:XP_012752093.1 hypothetical protein SAMD00019534_081790 [Acytostelium subglobosum LB1]
MDRIYINQLTAKYLTSQWKNFYITGFLVSFLLSVRILRSIFRTRFNVKGKLAVVTGASSGIGLAIATELAKAGCSVCLVARTQSTLDTIVQELRQKGLDAHAVPADLSKPEDVARCHQEVMRIAGDRSVDILVNNAGAGNWKFIEETSMDECYSMMALPYFAAFNMTREFVPRMIANNSGYIINVNSPVSYQPWPGCVGYACSRFAMKGFTEALKADFRGTNIRVMEVIAGETSSNYFAANGIDDTFHMPYASQLIPKITPTDVGKGTVQALINNRDRAVIPYSLALIIGIGEMFPSFMRALLCRSPRGDVRIKKIEKEGVGFNSK